MAWQTVHEKIISYLVRIESQNGTGTGFLFAYNKNQVLAAIATAAHVVDNAHDWKQPIRLVHHQTGETVFLTDSDRVIFLDRKRDSASIVVPAKELKNFPKNTLSLLDPTKFKKVGIEVAWIGFPSVAYPQLCFFKGSISAFLKSIDCYLIDGVAINGVSGGPVFADDSDTPEIVGTVSAYMPNRVGEAMLPGLLKAQDISSFQETISEFRTFDDAREQEKEASKTDVESGETSSPSTEPPAAIPDSSTD